MAKCNKKTLNAVFGPSSKNFLKSNTNRENFTIFKIFIIKCDKKLSQVIHNCDP